MEGTVTEVIDANAKNGTTKQGKPWSMSSVKLNSGETVFTFNPVSLGDVLVKQINGEYTNWVKKKVDPKHDEIMKGLRELYKLVKEIHGRTPDTMVSDNEEEVWPED